MESAIKHITVTQHGGIHTDCTGHTCMQLDRCTDWIELATVLRKRANKLAADGSARAGIVVEWKDGTQFGAYFTVTHHHVSLQTVVTDLAVVQKAAVAYREYTDTARKGD